MAKALLSTSEIEGHFASALLAKVSPADLNSTLVALESLSVDSVASATSSMIDLVVTVHAKAQLRVDLCVDAEGFDQQPAIPAGWGGPDVGGADDPVHLGSRRDGFPLDRPDVHFLVASVSNGSCRAIISSGAEGATPLASSFKPIVLDARARAIKAGKVSWDEKLTITSATKSVRSGILQAEPDGTRIGAQDVASDMISISDNTAADMLAGKPPGGPVLLPATGRHRR